MRAWTWLVIFAGCGGGAHQIAIGPPPARQTQGTFAGPLCAGDHCTCRDLTAAGDGGAGLPTDDAHKRFEVRLGPSSQELWATVRGNVLYKSPERAEECFYVDLPSGDTPIELRASAPSGVSAQWSIRELGTKTASWYDSFLFNCGSPGVCSFDDLDAARKELEAKKHHVMDMCGSVKIKGLTWDTGHAPDQLHPSELLVRATLDVYKRAPDKAHGDATCGAKRDLNASPSGDAPAAPSSDAP